MSREHLVESYRNARRSLESNNVEESIFWLNKYSDYLPSDLSHEPKYWLVEQYLKVGKHDEAFETGESYLEGCKYPHAANKAKEFAILFKSYDLLTHTVSFMRLSKKYTELQKALRKKENELIHNN
jgi:hypothetical protein